jgi:hypothetical protein
MAAGPPPPPVAPSAAAAAAAAWLGRVPVRSADSSRATSSSVAALAMAACAPRWTAGVKAGRGAAAAP